jgi:hypothetical protein
MIKLRMMGWAVHVALMGAKRKAYRILIGKPEGKRSLIRGRHRREDNIQMHLTEIGRDYMDWIDLDQDREHWRALLNVKTNLRVP